MLSEKPVFENTEQKMLTEKQKDKIWHRLERIWRILFYASEDELHKTEEERQKAFNQAFNYEYERLCELIESMISKHVEDFKQHFRDIIN